MLIIKMVGCMAVLVGGIGTGYKLAVNCANKRLYIETFLKVLMSYQNELEYTKEPLDVIFTRLSKRESKEMNHFLEQVSNRVKDKQHTMTVEQIWKEELRKSVIFSEMAPDDYALIEQVGQCFGYLDIESQLDQLSLCIKQLEIKIEEYRNQEPQQIKMYRSLGVLGALFVIIILF